MINRTQTKLEQSDDSSKEKTNWKISNGQYDSQGSSNIKDKFLRIVVCRALVTVLKAFYGMETELSRRKEDWEELNKIDLEQFYKLRLSERFHTFAQINCIY